MQSKLQSNQRMDELVETIKDLEANERIRKMVDDRMNDFKKIHQMDTNKWYEELVYCLLTAFSSALMGQKCVDALCCDNLLYEGTQENIRECLISNGHRFPNKRAEYIYNTKPLAPILKDKIQRFGDSRASREWLVENIKGFGWKEASHYLRNVGYFDLAIIDRHIMNNLREYDLIDLDPQKGLTKKRYLEVEKIIEKLASRLDMLPGELDLYMWYRKTGKVLK